MSKGASPETAARAIGISRATWFRWMKRGESGDERAYRRFYLAVRRAQSECAIEALQVIHEAAQDGNWKAAAWLLERRYGYTTSMCEREAVIEAELKQADDPDEPVSLDDPEVQAEVGRNLATFGARRLAQVLSGDERARAIVSAALQHAESVVELTPEEGARAGARKPATR